jgi:hypothetical protein
VTLSDLTKVHVYIPSLPPNTIKVYPSSERGGGAGSTNKDFGNNIYNGVVTTMTPVSGNQPQSLISIYTDVNTTGVVSIALETAKDMLGCESFETDSQGPLGGIIGPGNNPSAFVPIETDTRVELGGGTGGTICAKKHPMTGCIKYFYSCSDTSQNPVPLPSQNTPPVWFDGELVDMGDLKSPLCREAIITRKGSPIQYWGVTNGTFYCLGVYDTGTSPYWFDPCDSHPDFPYFEGY